MHHENTYNENWKKKIQLRGNNSVCAGAFQLLYGRAPAQLRENTELHPIQKFIKICFGGAAYRPVGSSNFLIIIMFHAFVHETLNLTKHMTKGTLVCKMSVKRGLSH
jgi:hypothetical protein